LFLITGLGAIAAAGVGVEVVMRDKRKKIVAKIRHFDSEGTERKQAAEEVAGHVAKFAAKN
jgi:hypothetical protein